MATPWYWNSDSNQTGDKSYYNNPYGQDLAYRLQQALAGGAFNNAEFLSKYIDPMHQQTIRSMLGMMTPEGSRGMAANQGTSIMAQSGLNGARQAAIARAQGLSPGYAMGVQENATNAGRTMATQNYARQTDPLALLMRREQVLQGGGVSPGSQWLSQLLGQAPAVPERGPSIFESLLGAASSASSMGWKPFGGKK